MKKVLKYSYRCIYKKINLQEKNIYTHAPPN
jgi:hypothetical protein